MTLSLSHASQFLSRRWRVPSVAVACLYILLGWGLSGRMSISCFLCKLKLFHVWFLFLLCILLRSQLSDQGVSGGRQPYAQEGVFLQQSSSSWFLPPRGSLSLPQTTEIWGRGSISFCYGFTLEAARVVPMRTLDRQKYNKTGWRGGKRKYRKYSNGILKKTDDTIIMMKVIFKYKYIARLRLLCPGTRGVFGVVHT